MATISEAVPVPGPKLVQSLIDNPRSATFLAHHNRGIEELRKKVGQEIFKKGSMYLVDLRNQKNAVELEVVLDQKSPNFKAIDGAMKGKGELLRTKGLRIQIARTNQVKFADGITNPKTEFTLLHIDRNAFEPVAPGNLYTLPSGQDAKQVVIVMGIIGTTQENNKNTGAILWLPDSFYLSDAKLALPGGGE